MPWFGSKKEKQTSDSTTDTTSKKEQKEDSKESKEEIKKKLDRRIVLVFDGNPSHDWTIIFKDMKCSDGKEVHIYQASWNKTGITVYEDGPRVSLAPLHESDNKVINPATTTIKPDFVLIRNQPRGAIPATDCRNILYGLMMANIPSMNSWQSIYFNLERPIMLGGLKTIQNKLGKDKFPLIDVTYYSGEKQMIIGPDFPAIIKVSHAHAGMGKIKVNNHEGFRDVATIIAVNDNYCTGEKYIEPEYGFRIQKIGDNYCVMKKYFTGSGWKSHFGGSVLIEDKLTNEYKLWADEASKLFGGMDILALDGIHGKNGKDYIIELNGSSIGILSERWKSDSIYLAKMVISKMNNIYCNKQNINKKNN